MTGPLRGIRVFDMGHAAVGAWAGMLLGALGADVLKIEGPKGDVSLKSFPRQRGVGVIYITNNANKRSVTLDLRDPDQYRTAQALIQRCDVLIENFTPGTMERLGLGYQEVSRLHPTIVYCSASAFGANKGPMGNLRGYDPIIQAFSGFASINGKGQGKPEFFRQVGYIDKTVACYVLAGVLRGLLARSMTGTGMHVEVTMLGSALGLLITRAQEYLLTGTAPVPLGSASGSTTPHEAFQCGDGKFLAVGVLTDPQWQAMCSALDMPGLLTDKRFQNNAARAEHSVELRELLSERFKRYPLRWWEIQLSKAGVPNGRFLDPDAVMDHVHATASEALQTLDSCAYGRMTTGCVPWRFSRTVLGPTRPPGVPGEHTSEVLAELGGVEADA